MVTQYVDPELHPDACPRAAILGVCIIFWETWVTYPLGDELAKPTTTNTMETASLPSDSHLLRSGHPKACTLFKTLSFFRVLAAS